MKKIILALGLAALVAGRAETAKAGGWPIAVGVTGGVVAGAVIADSIAYHGGYYGPGPAYCYPPVVYPRAYCGPGPVVVGPGYRYGYGYGYGYRPGYGRGYYHGYRR